MRCKKVFLAAFVLALLLPASLFADCNSYSNVTPMYDRNFGNYCGSDGPGCTECVYEHEGGIEVCIFYSSLDVYCTDYGQEFQWP